MSIASWKKEFYTEFTAAQVKRWSKKKTVEHSLKKWRGLTAANRKKHGLFPSEDWFSGQSYRKLEGLDSDSDDSFSVCHSSCALCKKYYNYQASEGLGCIKCPLFQSHKAHPCNRDGIGKGQFGIYADTGNAGPMIRALEKTLVNIETGKIK
jgi:hypothetical protein